LDKTCPDSVHNMLLIGPLSGYIYQPRCRTVPRHGGAQRDRIIDGEQATA